MKMYYCLSLLSYVFNFVKFVGCRICFKTVRRNAWHCSFDLPIYHHFEISIVWIVKNIWMPQLLNADILSFEEHFSKRVCQTIRSKNWFWQNYLWGITSYITIVQKYFTNEMETFNNSLTRLLTLHNLKMYRIRVVSSLSYTVIWSCNMNYYVF